MTAHLYRPLLRPASFCTLPRGIEWSFVEAPHDLAHIRTDLPRSLHVHGVISVDRQLTNDECDQFDLRLVDIYVSPDDVELDEATRERYRRDRKEDDKPVDDLEIPDFLRRVRK